MDARVPRFLLGVPHAVTRDDTYVYLVYRITKDAIVILNVWWVQVIRSAVTLRIPRPVELTREARAVHNDPTRHPDRRRFEPLRYIDDHQTSVDAANNPDATKRDHFVFGAGRRRCQGMHIADRSIFLAISRLLWAFDFKRAVDSQTNEEKIPDMDDLADRIMSLPNPFPADIVPRNSYKA
ncbi:cytochrome P450 [Xylaria longipes]|nr:cytochrome P450 [Xylaria longipes]